MSAVIQFSVPTAQFPIGEALAASSDGPVRLETLVPTGDAVVPYLWVPTADADRVERALADSPLVEQLTAVDEAGEETLFRVRWTGVMSSVIEAIRESGGALLEASGTDTVWTFRARFDDHTDVSTFNQWCVDAGVSLTLEELHRSPHDGVPPTLTDLQREALLAALETGYYDVPRAVTLAALADRLDISDTALSQRLRRGTRTLLSSTLDDDTPSPVDGDDEH
jgi:predicted DNA binding protein